MDLDATNRRPPWTTPELRHTDASTTELSEGPFSDGLFGTFLTISVN